MEYQPRGEPTFFARFVEITLLSSTQNKDLSSMQQHIKLIKATGCFNMRKQAMIDMDFVQLQMELVAKFQVMVLVNDWEELPEEPIVEGDFGSPPK